MKLSSKIVIAMKIVILETTVLRVEFLILVRHFPSWNQVTHCCNSIDSFKWENFATDNGHTIQTYSIDITVVDPVMIYSASVNATVCVGESFRFSCNASNFLRLQWVYMTNSTHSHVLSNTSDGRVTITPDFDLQLSNIAIEDGGTYQCLLSNNKNCSSLTNTLYVTGERTLCSIRTLSKRRLRKKLWSDKLEHSSMTRYTRHNNM